LLKDSRFDYFQVAETMFEGLLSQAFLKFIHSGLCIETPLFLVIYPTILSPG